MKWICNLQNLSDLETLSQQGVSEIILSAASLSRYGRLSLEEVKEAQRKAKSLGIKTSLDCDLILNENQFPQYIQILESLSGCDFDAYRACDPGLLLYLKEKEHFKLQILLEMGNHNLKAIQTWVHWAGESLDRVVLCPEIPLETIRSYQENLKCSMEYLGLGRILLFYSPRKLLSPIFQPESDSAQLSVSNSFLTALGHSEESAHKGFPLVESLHGSFMFNPKDLCILDYVENLRNSGLTHLRVDPRPYQNLGEDFYAALGAYFREPTPAQAKEIKELWPEKLIRGYSLANKSNALFSILKNTHNQRMDKFYVGDILETETGRYSVLELKAPGIKLEPNTSLYFKTPDKKYKSLLLADCIHISGKRLDMAQTGDFLKIPHSSGVSSNTRVYLQKMD